MYSWANVQAANMSAGDYASATRDAARAVVLSYGRSRAGVSTISRMSGSFGLTIAGSRSRTSSTARGADLEPQPVRIAATRFFVFRKVDQVTIDYSYPLRPGGVSPGRDAAEASGDSGIRGDGAASARFGRADILAADRELGGGGERTESPGAPCAVDTPCMAQRSVPGSRWKPSGGSIDSRLAGTSRRRTRCRYAGSSMVRRNSSLRSGA